jgi:hypothetical protein
LLERAAPKVKSEVTNVRVLVARRDFLHVLTIAKVLKLMVARDAIEPPTPAFSEPLTVSRSGLKSIGSYSGVRATKDERVVSLDATTLRAALHENSILAD